MVANDENYDISVLQGELGFRVRALELAYLIPFHCEQRVKRFFITVYLPICTAVPS